MGLMILYFLLAAVQYLFQLCQFLPQLPVGPGYFHFSEVAFIKGFLQLWDTKGKLEHFNLPFSKRSLCLAVSLYFVRFGPFF